MYKQRLSKRQINTINFLKESKLDILYIRTESGYLTHVSIDNYTFCEHGAGLIYYRERNLSKKEQLCTTCLGMIHRYYVNPPVSSYREPTFYNVKYRCSMVIRKKEKMNKTNRCSRTTNGAFNSMCSQHTECFSKYLHKYTSFSSDVCKLICKLL